MMKSYEIQYKIKAFELNDVVNIIMLIDWQGQGLVGA